MSQKSCSIISPDIDKNNVILTVDHLNLTIKDFEKSILFYKNILKKTGSIAKKKVAVLIPDIPAYLSLFLAIHELGGTILPLSTQLKKDDLKALLDSLEPHIIFSIIEVEEFNFESELIQWMQRSKKETILFTSQNCEMWSKLHYAGEKRAILENKTDLIVCSSGSTGVPKGIMLNFSAFEQWGTFFEEYMEIEKNDRLLLLISPTTAFGLSWFLTGLKLGVRTIVAQSMNVPLILELVKEYQCTKVLTTPSSYRAVYSFAKVAKKLNNLSSVQKVIFGGEPVTDQFVHSITQGFEGELLGMYGLSEQGPLLYSPIDLREGIHWAVTPNVDFELSEENSEGIGEGIFRTLKGSFSGYYQQADLTNEVLKPDGWFYTGDLMRKENDYLEIVGRKKELIKKAGQGVIPAEIEVVLCRYKGVKQAVVVGIPDEIVGEKIAAFILTEEKVSVHELQMFCRDSFSSYKVPDFIIEVQEFPIKQGKINKIELRNLILT